MTINVPLLRKTLEHITAHPEEHNQSFWAVQTPCGTAYCLAGHAVQLAGHEILWTDVCPCGCDSRERSAWHCTDGREIEYVATEELGLTEDQADDLFESRNTLHYLWRKAAHYTDGEIDVPEQLR
jgi:hypothetical protein